VLTNEGSSLEIADLEVHPQTRGVGEVMVYLDNPPAQKCEPPNEPVKIDQVNLRFRPRVVGAVAGQEVRFENNDTCNHAVQTLSSLPANQINLTAGPGIPIRHYFQAQREPIPVGCSLHPWMRAYVFVFPHRYFAVTNERGEFHLGNVPRGEYRLRIVHPLTGWQTQREVAVRPNQTVTLTIVWNALPDRAGH
jgi:plastocyanin